MSMTLHYRRVLGTYEVLCCRCSASACYDVDPDDFNGKRSAREYFRERGWRLGSEDYCPECAPAPAEGEAQ
jgi:hypothetical protein